jgi:hypothetical protein
VHAVFFQSIHLPSKFLRPLKLLLEDPTIKKIGNRICSDQSKLKGWDVNMKPTINTGHLEADCVLVTSRAASLASIVDALFPGVELDGKTGGPGCPRTSDWSIAMLSNEQLQYAATDGYATAVAYRALMQIMDPKVEGRIQSNEVEDGLRVTVYSHKWKSRVLEGTLRAAGRVRNKVNVEVDLSHPDTIFAPGTIVDVVGSDATITQRTLLSLQQQHKNDNNDLPNHVTIQVSLHFCRRVLNPGGSEPIQVNTEKKQVMADSENYSQIHYQNYDSNDKRGNADSVGLTMSPGCHGA